MRRRTKLASSPAGPRPPSRAALSPAPGSWGADRRHRRPDEDADLHGVRAGRAVWLHGQRAGGLGDLQDHADPRGGRVRGRRRDARPATRRRAAGHRLRARGVPGHQGSARAQGRGPRSLPDHAARGREAARGPDRRRDGPAGDRQRRRRFPSATASSRRSRPSSRRRTRPRRSGCCARAGVSCSPTLDPRKSTERADQRWGRRRWTRPTSGGWSRTPGSRT